MHYGMAVLFFGVSLNGVFLEAMTPGVGGNDEYPSKKVRTESRVQVVLNMCEKVKELLEAVSQDGDNHAAQPLMPVIKHYLGFDDTLRDTDLLVVQMKDLPVLPEDDYAGLIIELGNH